MTRTMKWLSMVMALACLFGTGAWAATLYTPPLRNQDSTNHRFTCRIANVSNKEVTVRIEVFGESGIQEHDTGEVVLAPGAQDDVTLSESVSSLYSRFTLNGGKKRVRAVSTILELGTGDIAAVEAQ